MKWSDRKLRLRHLKPCWKLWNSQVQSRRQVTHASATARETPAKRFSQTKVEQMLTQVYTEVKLCQLIKVKVKSSQNESSQIESQVIKVMN